MIRYWSLTLIALSLLLIFTNVHSLVRNNLSVNLNKAVASNSLNHDRRLLMLEKVLSRNDVQGDHLKLIANSEHAGRTLTDDFLSSIPEYSEFEPGRQFLINPDFAFGLIGWGQYNSSWTIDTNENRHSQVVSYAHHEVTPSSLFQTLKLPSGECFVFSILGEVIREDDTPTYWGYWELYDDQDNPIGNSALASIGDQPWQTRYEVFCLPGGEENALVKVTIAPVNIYGDATVRLGSVRLHILQERDIEQHK